VSSKRRGHAPVVLPGTTPNAGGWLLESLSVVIAIVLVNVAVLIYQKTLIPIDHARFNLRYGAVPADMCDAWRALMASGPRWDLLPLALPLVTASCLHASFEHLVGNTVFLWVFGGALSQTVGRLLVALIYILGGMIAVVVYVHTNPRSEYPMIGGSGAIAALEGAYFTFAFRWELAPARVWPSEWSLRPVALALLAVANFVLDTQAFVGHSSEPVAYGAHVGGFLGGALLAMVIASKHQESPPTG
jgi:membrane associated rhomboid family serine protease